MKRIIKTSVLGLFTLLLFTFTFESCRDYDDFQAFPELDSLQTDSVYLDGTVAVPLINTEIKLGDFLPETDSSLWVEVDNDGLLHMRMYYKSLISFRMDEIFPMIDYTSSNEGTTVPAGQYSFESDPEKMKLYSNTLTGKLFFNNPRITFLLTNEIPLVTYFKMDTVHFYGVTSDLQDTLLTHAEDEPTEISAPSEIGTSEFTSILIDTTRIPYLDEAFSPIPKKVGFYVTAGSETDQTLPFDVNGSERITADVDIDLPMELRLVDLVLADTMDFTWDDTDYDQADSIMLKIEFDNGFPFEGIGQIYFADTTNYGEITKGNYIDSVFTDLSQDDIDTRGWIFGSASTDGIGVVTVSNKSEINVMLTQERVKKLQDMHASKVILQGRFNHDPANTVPDIYVRINDDYTLGIKMGMKLNYAGSTNDDF